MKLKLAVRNIVRHRTRSLITLIGISFGGTALIFSNGLVEQLYKAIGENGIYSRTGHFQLHKIGYAEKGLGRPFDFLIDDYETVRQRLTSIEGVRVVSPRLEFGALLSNGEANAPVFVLGVDPTAVRTDVLQKEQIDRIDAGLLIEKGRMMTPSNLQEILVGRDVPKRLHLDAGSDMILFCRTVDGSMNGSDVKVSGIYASGSQEFDANTVLIPFKLAQQLVRTEAAMSLVIELNHTKDTERVRKEIQRILKENDYAFEISDWAGMNDFYQKSIAMFAQWMGVIRFLIGFLMLLGIYTTMSVAVSERTAEIGTLMSMGSTRREILLLFMTEGLALGVIGGICGVAIGVIATSIAAAIGIPLPVMPGFSIGWLSRPMLVPSVMQTFFFISVGSSTLATLPFAFRASRLQIAEALRHSG